MTCPSWPPPSGHAPLSSATSFGESAAAGDAARPAAALADLPPFPAVVVVRLAAAPFGRATRAVWAGAVRRVATVAHSMPPHEGPWSAPPPHVAAFQRI